jgi:hypothetical protein
MKPPRPPRAGTSPATAAATAPSRRRFLGGALAAGLAAALLPADRVVVPARPWTGKARWIGHW